MSAAEEQVNEIDRLYAHRNDKDGGNMITKFVTKFGLKDPKFWNTPFDPKVKDAIKDLKTEAHAFGGVTKGEIIGGLMSFYMSLVRDNYKVQIDGKTYNLGEPTPEFQQKCDEFSNKQPKTLGGLLDSMAFSLGEKALGQTASGQTASGQTASNQDDKTMLYVGIGGATLALAAITFVITRKSKKRSR